MFVGLDIRSDSVLAVRVGEDGTVGARAVREGRTGTVGTAAVKAAAEGTAQRMGAAFKGAHGSAGDAAWLALNPVEGDDYRKLGCLEAEMSGKGTARRQIWRVKTGDHSRALDLAGTSGAITIAHVLDAACEGDGVAVSAVRDTAKYIGMAVANLVAVVDPHVVVLSGMIATASDLLVEPSRTEAVRRMSPRTVPKIVASTLGDEAAAIGAARAAMLQA